MLCCVQSPRADVPGDSPEGSDAARDLVARRTPPSERTFPRGYRAPPMPSPLDGVRRDDVAGEPDDAADSSSGSDGEDPLAREKRRLLRRLRGDRPVDSADVVFEPEPEREASQKRRKRGRRRTRAKILLERSRPPQARDPPGVHPETPPGRVRTGDVHEGRGTRVVFVVVASTVRGRVAASEEPRSVRTRMCSRRNRFKPSRGGTGTGRGRGLESSRSTGRRPRRVRG